MNDRDFALFVQAYFVCMLWSSTECNEEGTDCMPLDDSYSVEDIAQTAVEEQTAECRDFCEANLQELTSAASHPWYSWEQAGHDFWLTRCGHGAGFWDRGLPQRTSDALSNAARIAGNRDPYVGDDGLIYVS